MWLECARGLSAAGHATEAIKALEWLVESHPAEPVFRFELSNAHAAVGNYHRARLCWSRSRTRAWTPMSGWPPSCGPPQCAIRGERHLGPARPRPAAGCVAGPAGDGRASSEDVIRFAQIAVDHRVEDPSGAGLAEAEQAIVDALEQSPGDVSLLEHQLLIRQLTGDPRVHDSLRELERVRPDSPLLQAFVEQPTDRQVLEETQARLARLFQDAVQSDPSTRAAALTDLGAEVARFPGEVQRRTAYALALMIAGRHDEAVEQASVGARLAGDDHAMHFNLGQVFLGAGKVKRARKHLLLARQYAVDDEERADADAARPARWLTSRPATRTSTTSSTGSCSRRRTG